MSGEGASNPPDLHDISRDLWCRKLTLITKHTHRIPIKITISTSVSQGQCFVTPSIILRFSCIIYTAMRGERKSRWKSVDNFFVTHLLCDMFCYIFPHFKGGSEITLGTTAVETCDLLFGRSLFWHYCGKRSGHLTCMENTKGTHDSPPSLHLQVINYDSSRGGVSVITEKGDVTTSFLLIQNADLADSGKYSCAPSNADVASVRVHVLNGKYPLPILPFTTTLWKSGQSEHPQKLLPSSGQIPECHAHEMPFVEEHLH